MDNAGIQKYRDAGDKYGVWMKWSALITDREIYV